MDSSSNNVSNQQAGQAQQSDASKDPNPDQDVTQFVHSLLQQMQERFQSMSDQIMNRIDDMGTRIDDLEQNLNSLMSSAGIPTGSGAGGGGIDGSIQHHPQSGAIGRGGGDSNESNVCDSTQGNK